MSLNLRSEMGSPIHLLKLRERQGLLQAFVLQTPSLLHAGADELLHGSADDFVGEFVVFCHQLL